MQQRLRRAGQVALQITQHGVAVVRWGLGRERWLLAGLALLAALVAVFVEVADEVVGGDSHGIDRRILLALRNAQDLADPIGPRWFEELVRDFTALGGIAVLMLAALGGAGFLWLARRRRRALELVLATFGALLASTLLKWGFDRPRPDLVPHGMHVLTKSFPSGHAMLSAAIYLTLSAFVTPVLPTRVLRVYTVGAALVLTGLVGMSRVYLGVHWPSDVLAGWSIGAAWAVGSLTLARWLRERGPAKRPQAQARSAEDAPRGELTDRS